ncbi:hypothetical protein ACQ4PT_069886 [Festuca glaucescens]
MADEPLDASPAPATPAAVEVGAPAPAPAPAPPATASPVLRPRRESFEHGLLPIPKLVFPEGTLTQTLTQLKGKLAASGTGSVGAAALAEALQIPADQAALALGTLAAVLPAADDPAEGSYEADLRDVLLFLYIQSYKRLVPRAHKDSPSVADVWPSTSAFDGYLSALSPIQILLMEKVMNLCSPKDSLSQAAPFFANSDPDMPAAPVPATQVLNCHDSVIYILAPLKYATVYGCSDITVVLGAIGVSDVQAESATCLDPELFTNFLLPCPWQL